MTVGEQTRDLTYVQALNEALREEMELSDSVFLIGEDIAAKGGVFNVTEGLLEQFGADRVIDSPISEAGITGIAVGAAMTGSRPVVEIMFGDFLCLAMDQIVNQAAKVRYMSGGELSVPMVVRTTMGAGRRMAAQHSQSLHALMAHIPGLKVVVPSTPADGKGLLKSAIRDPDPVIFFEDKMSYRRTGPVSSDPELLIPLGSCRVVLAGDDLTIVAISSTVHLATEAAAVLGSDGWSVEVIDVRTLWPLDAASILRSVNKTSRCLVIDEGYTRFGATAEIASLVAEGAFDRLVAPVRRIASMDVPVPFSPVLEDLTRPSTERVVSVGARTHGAVQMTTVVEVVMPAMEAGQVLGKLVRWLYEEGATVQEGAPLMEIETDKISLEIESPATGVLKSVSAQSGDEVPVGQVIALIERS